MLLRVETGVNLLSARLFSAQGSLVWQSGPGFTYIPLPSEGVYFLEIKTDGGIWTEKVVRN